MSAVSPTPDDVFTLRDVARAARVPVSRAAALANAQQTAPSRGCLNQRDAVRLVRLLSGAWTPADTPLPITLIAKTRRRGGVPLFISGTLHVVFFVLILGASAFGWLKARDSEQRVLNPEPVRLVFLVTPGPSAGGGGGGLQAPSPPPRAERKAPVIKKVSSPVPPPVRRPPPPTPPRVIERPAPPPPPIRPVEHPAVAPRVDPPKPASAVVQAPVAQVAAAPVDRSGIPAESHAEAPSPGPGTGGGVGSGGGTGLGEGRGGGIGDGSDGGVGGGPYRPGSGIDAPSLLREVKPSYTDDARRRSIEGNVVLEIVVRRDGSVGDVHVIQSLGAGLEAKAIEAVRQWRFAPARRRGTAVDVIAEVSVEFKLR